MPTVSSARRSRLGHLGVALVLLAAVCALGVTFAYRHAMARIDRRMAHSALFAARPRLQAVGTAHRRSSPLLTVSARVPARRLPAFDDLPPELVQAVVSTEDRRFFTHNGVNYLRTAQCAVEDTLARHIACGGSTITQQLARAYFLTQGKTVRRKVEEILIAHRLEQRLTKQQIFVMYTRAVSFGQNDGAEITGFNQAAQVFFHRPLRQLDLAEDALLAGMVHAPNYDNPLRHPDRALRRRNTVLDSMVATGAITEAAARAAQAEPLSLAATAPAPRPFDFHDGDAEGS